MVDVMVDKREDAIELLKVEIENEHDKMIPAEPILNYLIAKAKDDREFSQRVMLEGKTVKKCFEYVLQEVKKALDSKSGYLEDQIVYNMAVDYFVLEGELVEKAPEPPKKENKSVSVPLAPKEKEEKPQMSLFELGGSQ